MTSTRDMTQSAFILCAICFFINSDGKAVMKRSVSEVQIMHDLGEHLHSADRQNWLLEKLQTVHHAPEAIEEIKPRETRSWRLRPDHGKPKIQKKPNDGNKGHKDITFKTKPQ
ncbi:parathyroid hormone [Thamnophis elegans]|uniref:parathyroid hormone n=1 Tax=Thamnophis elegans TaxID=35005 RepID=UPI001377CFE8|nr:parathyroid hormone [Thamnophis elegans]